MKNSGTSIQCSLLTLPQLSQVNNQSSDQEHSNQNDVAVKLQSAWLSLDAGYIVSELSENVKYRANLTGNKITGRNRVIGHLSKIFSYLRDNHATTTSSKAVEKKFSVTHKYEALSPVTQYMVNSNGIFLVPCLEPHVVTLRVSVSLQIDNNLITAIKVNQAMNVLCTLNA